MSELREFDEKKYRKLHVKSVVVNGKDSTNIVNAEEMKNQQSISVNITVELPEEEIKENS